jgi:hypothetical protein
MCNYTMQVKTKILKHPYPLVYIYIYIYNRVISVILLFIKK